VFRKTLQSGEIFACLGEKSDILVLGSDELIVEYEILKAMTFI
jgi:hypothetical protein